MTSGSRWSQLRLSVIGFVGTAVIRLLSATWRIQRIDATGFDALLTQHKSFVFAIWHGEMLPLMCAHRHQGISCVISEHRDGEIIASIAKNFGIAALRGSTSRGGARVLLEVVSRLRSGAVVGITPDGPRGPRHTFAPGGAVAAQRAGVPVVGARALVDRAWRLGSWDAFMIPKPFARVSVVYSSPQRVLGASARDAGRDAPRLEAMMNSLGSPNA